MSSLIGVWKSTDKRENRHIYVVRTDSRYAYGWQCAANGLRLPSAREVRVQLNAYRDGLKRYRRPTAADPERGDSGGQA